MSLMSQYYYCKVLSSDESAGLAVENVGALGEGKERIGMKGIMKRQMGKDRMPEKKSMAGVSE